jgi:predicted aspartyl protease
MRGVVNARLEPILSLRLRGPTGIEMLCDVVVDTGSTSTLTITQSIAATLQLIRKSGGGARMADGSIRRFDVFTVEIEWDGVWRTIAAPAVGVEVLMGMKLIAGHELKIVAEPGGVVVITPLP